MVLRAGFAALALKIQEAASADELSSNDVRSRLSDAINDQYRGTGTWAYFIDYFGDGETGDVVYCADNDTFMAPYEISGGEGAAKCLIDFDKADDVVPRTVYEIEQDEGDHIAAMTESYKRDELYTELPLYERFIAKSERETAPGDDFAGKGKSFPILKAGDVMAAMHSLGRAGSDNYSTSVIRANIIRIAKRKGFPLPKSAQDEKSKEAAAARSAGALRLVESAGSCFLSEIHLQESARTTYPIKLISPGTGTSAHYTPGLLKKEAAKFKAGTLMFWNHPTDAEEAARPEGDLNNLAAITTRPAEWREDGPKGPGLYSEAKVMADYAQKVEERAPHIGVSIRAGGHAGKDLVDGKPVLESIDYVESVDYVTRAGRGGLALAEAARDAGILTEAAPAANNQGGDMDEAAVKRLIESARREERAIAARRNLAVIEAGRMLQTTGLPEVSQRKIVESVTGGDLPVKADGTLDVQKLTESVSAAAKAEGEYLAQVNPALAGRVTGMGVTSTTEAGKGSKACPECDGEGVDGEGGACETCDGLGKVAREAFSQHRSEKRLREAAINSFAQLMGGNLEAAEKAVMKGAA